MPYEVIRHKQHGHFRNMNFCETDGLSLE